MNADSVKIEVSWREALRAELESPYFEEIVRHIKNEKAAGKTIYPPGRLIFNAFDTTPIEQVKVVILGQDPYHGPGEAMGLSFSVPRGVRVPPSLKNIYKEIQRDLDYPIPTHGDLQSWADQGVLMLNSMLTVRHKEASSHRQIGWQQFTDGVIRTISDRCTGVVFLLWGRFAQSKAALIDATRHHVLTAAHPSPLARNAFSGCAHFSKTNDLLIAQNKEPIKWQIE